MTKKNFILTFLILFFLVTQVYSKVTFKEVRTASDNVIVAFFASDTVNIEEIDTTDLSQWKINGLPAKSINKYVMQANKCNHHIYLETDKLVKGKKYKEAVGFLAPLKDFPAGKPDSKFHLAFAQLKLHSHTVATHRQHPAIELFTELYRNSSYPVFETLRKDKTLAPEELFSLGFGLVERSGQERGLGVDLLEHIAEKFPRNKIGKNAKNKLKLISW